MTALPARTAITFTPGLPPLATNLTRYYEEAKRLPGRFRRFLLNLELTTAAVCLLALAIGLGWGLSRIKSNPKGTPKPKCPACGRFIDTDGEAVSRPRRMGCGFSIRPASGSLWTSPFFFAHEIAPRISVAA